MHILINFMGVLFLVLAVVFLIVGGTSLLEDSEREDRRELQSMVWYGFMLLISAIILFIKV